MAEGTIRPPTVKGHWFWGSLLERRDDPLRLFTEAHARLGETVAFPMGPWATVLSISNPDHIKHVLIDAAGKYYKGKGIERMKPLLGEGLLTSEGSFWMRQRRLASPAFHKERIAGFARTMVESTQELIARWTPGQPLDVAHEMMRLALTIATRTLFSSDVSNDADRIGE